MSNPMNHGTVIGRLARDPKIFTNSDGSKKVMITLYADHNYTSKDGQRGSDIVELEAFVRSTTEGVGPYGSIHQGDLIAVDYALRQDRYMRNGAEVFELKAVVDSVSFLESRSVTQARLAERVAKAEQVNASTQAAAAATAPVEAAVPAHAVQAQAASAQAASTRPVQEELPFS